MAAILVHDSIGDVLKVVSVGVGTKTLSVDLIREDESTRRRVRDMHAEVLARRGALRFIYSQINTTLSNSKGDNVKSIFQTYKGEGDATMFTLRPTVTFHLYTSSTPCGNSCIKRWAKGRKPNKYDDLPPSTFPTSVVHPRFFVTAREQGQVALLVKKDGKSTRNKNVNDTDNDIQYKLGESESDVLGGHINGDMIENAAENVRGGVGEEVENVEAEEEEKEVIESGIIFPSGTLPASHTQSIYSSSPPPDGKVVGGGCVMTCSDKIAKWNCLGIQGCLLSHVLSAPIYFETITIGRKFGQPYAERALCCRVSQFSYPPPSRSSSSSSSSTATAITTTAITATTTIDKVVPIYKTKHPAILCTNVKFDQGCLGSISNSNSMETLGNTDKKLEGLGLGLGGAKFNESRCFSWWYDAYDGATVSVLNSHTGMLSSCTHSKEDEESALSSHALYVEFCRLQERMSLTSSLKYHEKGDCQDDGKETSELIKLGLDQLKNGESHYVAARNFLYSSPSLLNGWIRGCGL